LPNLKDLATKKGRDEAGLFIVEGEKFISEIPENYRVRLYVVSQNYAGDVSRFEQKARCEVVRTSLFNKLADTVTPQGVIAVCEKNFYTAADMHGFILSGENLNDPGNVGTLIRTAAAAGAGGAIFTHGSCDVFSPKVIRASAGAVLRMPVMSTGDAPDFVFDMLKERGTKIYAAHPRGDFLPYDLNLREDFCLIVGNESHGVSPAALARADATVRLPMTAATESLNAAVAGSILMYEAVRQRSG